MRNFILCSLGGNSFAFVHRTFAEYFCAYDLFKKCTGINRQLSLDDLQSQFFGHYWDNENWHEILRLLVGLLSSNDDNNIDPIKSIMEHLLALDGKYCAHLNVFLVADFLMEVRNRQLYSQVDSEILERLGELAKLSSSDPEYWRISDNACHSIGRVWQGEQSGCKKLQELATQSNDDAIYALPEYYRHESDIYSIIKELAIQGTEAAIDVLAEYYRHELDTHSIVKEFAIQGNISAIYPLARHYRDESDTYSIIKELAIQGNEAAIDALAECYRDEPDTHSIFN